MTLVEELIHLPHALKIKEQKDNLWNITKLEELKGPKKASVHLDSLRIEQPASIKETPLFKSEVSPEPISLAEISLPRPRKQPKSDSLIKSELTPPKSQLSFRSESAIKVTPLLTTESSLKFDPFYRTLSLLSLAQSPFKFEPLPETAASIKTELFHRTQFSFTSNPPINIELFLETGTLPRTNFNFTTKTPFKPEPSWKALAPFVSDSLFGTESFLTIKPPYKDVLTKRALAGKELLLEQNPLPSSPLL
jgi:hypothetical protein